MKSEPVGGASMDPDQSRKPGESQHSLGEGTVVRPLQDAERGRRGAPFAAVAAVAFVAVLLVGTRSRAGEVIAAGLLAPFLVASVYLVPWWRLPAWAQAAPPLLYFAIVALLRDAAGADASIFTALVLLPVFWFALYGTRPQLLVSVAGVFVTLAAPALIVGAPEYPPRDELVRAVLWLVIAGALGLTVHRLVLEVRARFVEYRSILETAHESFIAAGADGQIVDWNQQAERDFGWSRDEVIGRQLADTVIPPRSWDIYREGFDHLSRTGEHTLLGRRFEMPAVRRDGSEFPVEITVSALPSDGGYRLNLFLHDISERRASDRALREAEERFRRSFHDSAAGMAIVSTDGEWLQVNQALADLTGYAKGELTGMVFAELTHPDDVDAEAEALDQLVAGERGRYVTEKRYVRADGQLVWVSLSLSPIRDEDGETLYLISQMQDVTERKQTEAKLAHQAMHDPLTGLPNRTLLTDRMLLAKARLRRGGSLALLFCDLDHFKAVNDNFGHDAGDQLLTEAADRLRSILRPSDTVSRFGGDEFALLCEGVESGTAERIASRIAEVLRPPFVIDGHEVSLSASIGIVLTSDPEVDPDQLMSDADLAMYAAKQGGGGRHALFGHEMGAHPPVFASPRRGARGASRTRAGRT
jgi:diguanylate cyclase (GGDEF)-like protein/PAS domain S-box-containing protein